MVHDRSAMIRAVKAGLAKQIGSKGGAGWIWCSPVAPPRRRVAHRGPKLPISGRFSADGQTGCATTLGIGPTEDEPRSRRDQHSLQQLDRQGQGRSETKAKRPCHHQDRNRLVARCNRTVGAPIGDRRTKDRATFQPHLQSWTAFAEGKGGQDDKGRRWQDRQYRAHSTQEQCKSPGEEPKGSGRPAMKVGEHASRSPNAHFKRLLYPTTRLGK